MKYTNLLLLFCGFVLSSCLDTALEATDSYIVNRLSYLDGEFDDLGISNDPFNIIAVTPKNRSSWNVIVEYSGGCNEHSFYTWWDTNWETAGQERFFLAHHGNGDDCDATVRDTLNLSINEIFNQSIADSTIIRIVNESNGRDISVNPKLANIIQGEQCGLGADIIINPCGKGIWDDRWIILEDSVDSLPVWIIPVRAASGVSLETPKEDDYYVGFTLLFGFESAELSNSCYLTDAGYAVPAFINCFEEL
ncbi:hypothetical protein [Marinoscillum pacificum]|uniref:hypothetical protein n=1 Tax=Marinoscillum pacificum TaxID=392723 RepID=UPI002157E729|nr:hypothetical protein [Marinoscillum pacificum]